MMLASLSPLRSLSRRGILALSIVTGGCDNGVSNEALDPLVLSFAEGASSGDHQRVMTGETLREPLRVIVTRSGVPVPGVELLWYTTYGSIAADGPTDGSGIASAAWTMPTNLYGSREARVALPNEPTSSIRFTAQPSHPKVELVAGGAQVGFVGLRLDNELSVRVTWDGVPVSGRAVRWSGPEVEESAAVTDANGMVRGLWRLGPVAGQQTTRLQLSPHAFDGPQAVFGATAKPGPAAAMALVTAADTTGTLRRGVGDNVRVSAVVRDSYGNPVPEAGVAWTLTSSKGVLIAEAILETNQTGVSTGTIPIDSAFTHDDFTIKASLSGLPPLTRVFRVVDLLGADDGWGTYWSPQALVVPVGAPVRWGSRSQDEHLMSVVTVLSDTSVAVVETLGSIRAGQVLTHQFHTPGTYVVDCITPTHWWERMTIHVTP